MKTFPVVVIDDAPKVPDALVHRNKKLALGSHKFLDKRVLDLALHKHVIGCDAGLAGVERFGPQRASRGNPEICRSINDDGRFATQL